MNQKPSGEAVAVIGGGVIGIWSAWELADAGYRVTLIDASDFSEGCSHGNCGFLAYSHVLPLAQPGAVSSSLRDVFRKNSAFAIRPRLSVDSLRWFWQFSRRCNSRDMLNAARGISALLRSSRAIYDRRLASLAVHCQRKGLLLVFDDPKMFEAYEKTATLTKTIFGVSTKAYNANELLDLEPALQPIVAGAWHFLDDVHLSPSDLMFGLQKKIGEIGVQCVPDTRVESIVASDTRIEAVVANDNAIHADHFVFAAGASTANFLTCLGCNVPIEPGKGYSMTMTASNHSPRTPMMFADSHVAITPLGNQLRIGSTMEFAGFDRSVSERRLRLLTSAATKHLRDPVGEATDEPWFGWRPMTPNGNPIIARSPRWENGWINSGHGMLGLSMAPASAKLLRELFTGVAPHVDPAYYAANR